MIPETVHENADPLVEEFAARWLALGGAVHWASGAAESRQAVIEALQRMLPARERRPRLVAWCDSALSALDLPSLREELDAELTLWEALPGESTTAAAARLRGQAAAADLGLVSCAWAVSSTGTVAVYAAPGSGRSVSLLPPACIFVVRPERVVATLGEGFALLMTEGGDSADALSAEAVSAAAMPPAALPSAVNLISGPSRSADIEGELVVGVHGPGNVTVVIARGLD